MSRTIIIRGVEVEGWAAALYLKRKLARLVDRVCIIDSANDTSPRPAAIIVPPASRPFLHGLGLSEEILFRKADASFLLGMQVDDAEKPFVRAWGRYGAPANSAGFHHYWTRMLQAGVAAPFDRYSFGAELARTGRFIHPSNDPKKIESSFDYGYVLDAKAFEGFLRSEALEAGVEIIDQDRQEGPQEPWLTLDLQADVAGEYITWPDLPERYGAEDRIALEPSANRSLYRVSRDQDGLNLSLSSRCRAVQRRISFGAQAPVRSGRCQAPWQGRTVAMGAAACSLPDLNGARMRLLHATLDLLTGLLPADGAPIQPLADEYNRRATLMMDHAADYEALSLAAFSASGMQSFSSSGLARKVEQFVSRGRLVIYDDELQSDQDWITAFIGCGLVPERVSPLALGSPVEEVHRSYERLRQAIARAVAQLPSQQVYLDHLLQVSESASDAV